MQPKGKQRTVAILNVRLDKASKREPANLAKSIGACQSELVKSSITGKLAVHQAANTETTTTIPEWVRWGKYVALVRGSVAAVGDLGAEVVAAAFMKFRADPIHVTRKGKSIKPVTTPSLPNRPSNAG